MAAAPLPHDKGAAVEQAWRALEAPRVRLQHEPDDLRQDGSQDGDQVQSGVHEALDAVDGSLHDVDDHVNVHLPSAADQPAGTGTEPFREDPVDPALVPEGEVHDLALRHMARAGLVGE
jgi:hypothetical protein